MRRFFSTTVEREPTLLQGSRPKRGKPPPEMSSINSNVDLGVQTAVYLYKCIMQFMGDWQEGRGRRPDDVVSTQWRGEKN